MGAITEIIVPIISVAIVVASFFVGRTSAAQKKGEEDGLLRSDVEYIKHRVDDVLLEYKDTNRTLGNHAERLTRVEESTKQAHKRIDGIESKGGKKND